MCKSPPLIVLALSLGFLSCSKSATPPSLPAADEIQIGEIDAISGPEAAFGAAAHRGIEFAIEELNSKGGIRGKKIKLTLLDDQGKAEESVVAAKKLVSIHKSVAILTGATSSRTMAMAPVVQGQGIPLLATAATHPKVTEQGDCIFRISFIDPFQGSSMARFAKDNLKVKKVAIISDIKNDYSMGLSEAFKQGFLKAGGQIVATQFYSSGDIDFRAQLTALSGKHVEAIFVPGYYGDVGLMARQAVDLGIKVPLLGGDGWDSPKLVEIAGTSLSGSFFSGFYSPQDKSGNSQEFVKKFTKKYGATPDAAAALGYEGMHVLAAAMNKSDLINPSKIRDSLTNIRNFDGLGGKLTINKKRDAIRSVVIMRISNQGKFEYQATILPEE